MSHPNDGNDNGDSNDDVHGGVDDGDGDEAQNNDMSPSCSLVTDRSSRSDNSISGAAPALTPIFHQVTCRGK